MWLERWDRLAAVDARAKRGVVASDQHIVLQYNCPVGNEGATAAARRPVPTCVLDTASDSCAKSSIPRSRSVGVSSSALPDMYTA